MQSGELTGGLSGFFLRDELGQQPGQTGSNAQGSPDIIVGAQPGLNTYFYCQRFPYTLAYPAAVSLGQPISICVRALNLDGGSGAVFLFAVPEALLAYPPYWSVGLGGVIGVDGEATRSQPLGPAAPGNVASAPDEYFTWIPALAPPSTSLCLIAYAMPAGQTPILPQLIDAADFDAYVLATPNLAAIRVQIV